MNNESPKKGNRFSSCPCIFTEASRRTESRNEDEHGGTVVFKKAVDNEHR